MICLPIGTYYIKVSTDYSLMQQSRGRSNYTIIVSTGNQEGMYLWTFMPKLPQPLVPHLVSMESVLTAFAVAGIPIQEPRAANSVP